MGLPDRVNPNDGTTAVVSGWFVCVNIHGLRIVNDRLSVGLSNGYAYSVQQLGISVIVYLLARSINFAKVRKYVTVLQLLGITKRYTSNWKFNFHCGIIHLAEEHIHVLYT